MELKHFETLHIWMRHFLYLKAENFVLVITAGGRCWANWFCCWRCCGCWPRWGCDCPKGFKLSNALFIALFWHFHLQKQNNKFITMCIKCTYKKCVLLICVIGLVASVVLVHSETGACFSLVTAGLQTDLLRPCTKKTFWWCVLFFALFCFRTLWFST